MVCLKLQREGRSHFFTSGSEVRDYHKVKMGLSGGASKHCGARRANVSVQKSDSECLWGLYLSVDQQCMHGIVSQAHTRWAKIWVKLVL